MRRHGHDLFSYSAVCRLCSLSEVRNASSRTIANTLLRSCSISCNYSAVRKVTRSLQHRQERCMARPGLDIFSLGLTGRHFHCRHHAAFAAKPQCIACIACLVHQPGFSVRPHSLRLRRNGFRIGQTQQLLRGFQ